MGAAVSTNVASVTMNSIATVATNVINKSINSSGQSIIITFKSDNGNIIISNNKFIQAATINTNTLLSAMTSSDVQQQLMQKLSQTAQSLVSGLNLGSYAQANNLISSYMNAVINISTNIKQYCDQKLSQTVSIDATTQNGNIVFDNNTISQVANLFSNCVLEALTQNQAIQNLQQQIDQSTKATAQGLSLTGSVIFAVVALVIAAISITIPLAFAVGKIFKYLSIFLAIVGIALIIYYFFSGQPSMSATEFSLGYSSTPSCNATVSTNTTYPDPPTAGNACLSDKKCAGFDWTPDQKTIMLSSIGNPNCDIISPTNNPFVLKPVVYVGNGAPTGNSGRTGDIYVDTNISGYGNYYIKPSSTNWSESLQPNGNIFTAINYKYNVLPIVPVNVGSPPFPNITQSSYVLQYGVNYNSIEAFYTDGKNSQDLGQIQISPISNVPPSNSVNWSGIKVDGKNKLFLYIGIALLIIAIIGFIASFFGKKEQK